MKNPFGFGARIIRVPEKEIKEMRQRLIRSVIKDASVSDLELLLIDYKGQKDICKEIIKRLNELEK